MNLYTKLVDESTAKAYIKKAFYNGQSSLFRLHDEDGKSTLLNIIDQKELATEIEYTLQIPKIIIGNEYTISDEHNLSAALMLGDYVRSKEFDDLYYYDGPLGPIYSKKSTTFYLWAPTAREVYLHLDEKVYLMEKTDKGVYKLTIDKNLDCKEYTYMVKVDGFWHEVTDPYAYSSTPNGKKSVVINPEKCNIPFNKEGLKPLKNYVDAVIYELHIRDFSVASQLVNKGKFLAFTEPHALDNIKDLGITHIQLLPFYDFGSVDEYNQFDYYNWGYDPVQYSVPEGSYASCVNDPYSRIIDCKKMIAAIHKNGMRVNMDVVYNHMFDSGTSAFQNIVPNYYFRYGANGEVSNGSFCGNDMDSTKKMVNRYMVDSCKRWFSFYGIDGMRFDLMGIIDYKTMNSIYKECKKIEPNIMIYGEGWNMPTLLDDSLKAAQYNNKLMPNIGFFNDFFRDNIKGKTSQDEIKKRGYATQEKGSIEKAMGAIGGTCLNMPYTITYCSPNQVVNYVECHDNATTWDKMLVSNQKESMDIRKRRQRLMNAIIALSQGIPFYHAGQEFFRTKGGDHNSYISSDDVNKLDYSLRKANLDSVNYLRDVLKIRKEYNLFRKTDLKDISEHIILKALDEYVIAYTLKGEEELLVLINPSNRNRIYNMDCDFEYLLDDSGLSKKGTSRKIRLNKCSLLVLKKH